MSTTEAPLVILAWQCPHRLGCSSQGSPSPPEHMPQDASSLLGMVELHPDVETEHLTHLYIGPCQE